jgi:hypothetical protein
MLLMMKMATLSMISLFSVEFCAECSSCGGAMAARKSGPGKDFGGHLHGARAAGERGCSSWAAAGMVGASTVRVGRFFKKKI